MNMIRRMRMRHGLRVNALRHGGPLAGPLNAMWVDRPMPSHDDRNRTAMDNLGFPHRRTRQRRARSKEHACQIPMVEN